MEKCGRGTLQSSWKEDQAKAGETKLEQKGGAGPGRPRATLRSSVLNVMTLQQGSPKVKGESSQGQLPLDNGQS